MTAHACTIVPARTVNDIDTIVGLAQTIWLEHYAPIIGADQVRKYLRPVIPEAPSPKSSRTRSSGFS